MEAEPVVTETISELGLEVRERIMGRVHTLSPVFKINQRAICHYQAPRQPDHSMMQENNASWVGRELKRGNNGSIINIEDIVPKLLLHFQASTDIGTGPTGWELSVFRDKSERREHSNLGSLAGIEEKIPGLHTIKPETQCCTSHVLPVLSDRG